MRVCCKRCESRVYTAWACQSMCEVNMLDQTNVSTGLRGSCALSLRVLQLPSSALESSGAKAHHVSTSCPKSIRWIFWREDKASPTQKKLFNLGAGFWRRVEILVHGRQHRQQFMLSRLVVKLLQSS